jgi:hypothetical protein
MRAFMRSLRRVWYALTAAPRLAVGSAGVAGLRAMGWMAPFFCVSFANSALRD